MPKSDMQKMKLLYLMKYLLEESDQDHPVSINDMMNYLAGCGIEAGRQTLYSDLECLRSFGLDIEMSRSKTVGYYVASRDFELPELKLLVDCVQSSKFVTQKKTMTLINKISGLAGNHDAKLLKRQVFVRNRVKAMNESVYYNVDEISEAINTDRAIKFKYFDYTISKKKEFRHDGKFYEVSPYSMMLDGENYYMIAFSHDDCEPRHYRVDKMASIVLLDQRRRGKKEFEQTDLSEYTKRVFGMYSGTPEEVRVRFTRNLVGVVIDRFGQDVFLTEDGPDHFIAVVKVEVSPQFNAWLFGFGGQAEIVSPQWARDNMVRQLRETSERYTDSVYT